MGRVVYRYRLTDSVKEDNMQIASVNLSKDWKEFTTQMDKLNSFIKSELNKSGLVDYEKVDFETHQTIYRSIANLEDIPIYTKSQLLTMSRMELCEICKNYAMVTTNKSNQFLAKEIFEKQSNLTSLIEEDKKVNSGNSQENSNKSTIEIDDSLKPKNIFDILKKK